MNRLELAWYRLRVKMGKVPRGRTFPKAEAGPVGGPLGLSVIQVNTKLVAEHFRGGVKVDERVVHDRVVTTAGVNAIVDAFDNTFELETFNYHDCGTGTGDEAVGDTALGTAVTEGRVTGTQTQPSANIYQSVATVTFSNTYAVTEHGLFSQSSKPGGTLLDRTKFSAINVVSGDSITFTFQITFTAGG